MSNNKANIILLILVIFIAIFGYLNLSVKDQLKEKKEEFLKFENSAKEIYLIKRLKKSSSSALSSLSQIKRPTVRDRGSYKIYKFENLNLSDLHRLIKRIQGAYLPIKKLEIKRDTTNHATVILEVAK